MYITWPCEEGMYKRWRVQKILSRIRKKVNNQNNWEFNGVLYNLSKYDCVIKPKYHKIIDIVKNLRSVERIFKGRFFGIEINDKRINDNCKTKCNVSSTKSKDSIKYIDELNFNEEKYFLGSNNHHGGFWCFSGFGR